MLLCNTSCVWSTVLYIWFAESWNAFRPRCSFWRLNSKSTPVWAFSLPFCTWLHMNSFYKYSTAFYSNKNGNVVIPAQTEHDIFPRSIWTNWSVSKVPHYFFWYDWENIDLYFETKHSIPGHGLNKRLPVQFYPRFKGIESNLFIKMWTVFANTLLNFINWMTKMNAHSGT